MKTKYALIIAAIAAVPLLYPDIAEAAKCRQYSKTIRIDGKLELGVGSACQQRDGTWEIVSLRGLQPVQDRLYNDIHDDLYEDGYNVVIVNNYRTVAPRYYAPYYPRVSYYSAPPRYAYKHGYKNNNKHHSNGKGNGHKKHH